VTTTQSERTVADVMLREPKTQRADVTVAGARQALEHASVKVLLLVDGERFAGAVTSIPAGARADEKALAFADDSVVVVPPETPVAEALERLETRASGRMIVLDGDRLVGLVCLASDGERFCGVPTPGT
jgi:CBS domain-containing protein